jgi:hypothetical protein
MHHFFQALCFLGFIHNTTDGFLFIPQNFMVKINISSHLICFQVFTYSGCRSFSYYTTSPYGILVDDECHLHISRIIISLFNMQSKTKLEETAPGVATGMILSLRERYCKKYNDFYLMNVILCLQLLDWALFKSNLYFLLNFSFAVFKTVRITLQHAKYVVIPLNWYHLFVPSLSFCR